jgi:hypothetical protein
MSNEINTFHQDTNPKVKELLTLLNHSRRRVRIWYGDTITGKAWNEEYDVTGIIGRSSGFAKIPLLIANRRSVGGGAILDHCIIRIDDTSARLTLYKHPNFHVDLHKNDRNEIVTSTREGMYIVHARFDSAFKADKYLAFMNGQRYSK